jgi:putative salt-induced outer membrane protein YdiY
VCLALIVVAPAFAQTAAPAKPATPAVPPPRDIVDARADLNFVNASGNSRTQTLGAAADVWIRPGTWAFRNRAALVRSEARDVLTAKSLTFLSRAERPAGRAFVFGQYDFLLDRLAGIAARHSASLGFQWKVWSDPRRTFSLFSGMGAARERRVSAQGIPVATIDTVFINGGWAYLRKFANGSEIKDDIRTDIALDRAHDWRVSHTLSVSAAVNSRVSLKMSHALRHVNLPPVPFKKTDAVASAGLVLHF